MIIISTLIGIIAITALTYVSYLIGIRVALILKLMDPEDKADHRYRVLATLTGAPVIMLICLAIKIAYQLGESIIAMIQ